MKALLDGLGNEIYKNQEFDKFRGLQSTEAG
jgi:hypothetical protein